MTADALEPLRRLLDDEPVPRRFWWRDDDAGPDHPRLRHLLALREALDLPLCLAVVPARLEPETAALIRAQKAAEDAVTVAQHGWAHADHAGLGERKIELGGAVDVDRLAADLVRGRTRLQGEFGRTFVPVMVPPWNRMSAAIEAILPPLGFRAVSTQSAATTAGHLPRIDVGIDLMDWKPEPRFRAPAHLPCLYQQARSWAPDEPIGIMTHHLVTDEEGFDVLASLLTMLRDHPRARLVSLGQLLAERGTA